MKNDLNTVISVFLATEAVLLWILIFRYISWYNTDRRSGQWKYDFSDNEFDFVISRTFIAMLLVPSLIFLILFLSYKIYQNI